MPSPLRPARHLLDQAHALARLDPTRPRQANLRRAISAAYYALFRLLVDEAVHRLLRGRNRAWLRPVLARAVNHSEVGKAARGILAQLPRVYEEAASRRAITVPAELREVARGFLFLIDYRHDADYDPARSFSRAETLELVDRVEGYFESWRAVRDEPATELFLLAMLTISRVAGR